MDASLRSRTAALSTMFLTVKRLMALSLPTQREQFEQRMNVTWPRPFLLRPPFLLFFVCRGTYQRSIQVIRAIQRIQRSPSLRSSVEFRAAARRRDRQPARDSPCLNVESVETRSVWALGRLQNCSDCISIPTGCRSAGPGGRSQNRRQWSLSATKRYCSRKV